MFRFNFLGDDLDVERDNIVCSLLEMAPVAERGVDIIKQLSVYDGRLKDGICTSILFYRFGSETIKNENPIIQTFLHFLICAC